jgi:hypothetical protein
VCDTIRDELSPFETYDEYHKAMLDEAAGASDGSQAFGGKVQVFSEEEFWRWKLGGDDTMPSGDREKMDILTLNDVSHDLSELSGFLLGKNGQGGMLREIKSDGEETREEMRRGFKELRSEIVTVRNEHHDEVTEVRVQLEKATDDLQAEHEKIRLLEGELERLRKSWRKFWDSALKVVLTVAGGVFTVAVITWLSRFLPSLGG